MLACVGAFHASIHAPSLPGLGKQGQSHFIKGYQKIALDNQQVKILSLFFSFNFRKRLPFFVLIIVLDPGGRGEIVSYQPFNLNEGKKDYLIKELNCISHL
jgi:hypothetical protein